MAADKEFTYADVSAHNTKKDLYMVIHDKVYNASSFVDEHPYVQQQLQLLPIPANGFFTTEAVRRSSSTLPAKTPRKRSRMSVTATRHDRFWPVCRLVF